MKTFYSSLFFLLINVILFASPGPGLDYTVSPLIHGNYSSFLIEMNLKGSSSGKTTITIPYETGLYRPQDQFTIIQILNCQKHQRVSDDSSLYVIEHEPNAPLTIRYTIKNALKDSLPALDEVYAQMLTDKYFYLIGSSAWVIPRDSSAAAYSISLEWKGFPTGWSWLNSFGANKANQKISAQLSDFQNAIYMGGDIRIHKLVINKRPLYFGIRGKWSFSDKEIFEIIKRTVSSQRTYWSDFDIDQYTIGLIPMKYNTDADRSINGRGLTNSFVTVGTNSKAFGLDDLVFLYNHELMHHWLGHVLKQGEPENAFKWFHEGFTDYFAHIVMRESGLLNEEQFKKRINNIFSVYYSDSTHQWSNNKLQQDYWASYEMQKLPYQRGLLFAVYLNESIHFYSKGNSSLKKIIQEMLVEARQLGKIFSTDWLLELLQKRTGNDYSYALELFITKGYFIPISEWKKVTGKLALLPTEVFDLGFTTDKRVIALNVRINSIDEGSNAQKAGLRINDIIVGFSSTNQPNDSTTVIVNRGGEKIKFRFLASRQTLVPQLK